MLLEGSYATTTAQHHNAGLCRSDSPDSRLALRTAAFTPTRSRRSAPTRLMPGEANLTQGKGLFLVRTGFGWSGRCGGCTRRLAGRWTSTAWLNLAHLIGLAAAIAGAVIATQQRDANHRRRSQSGDLQKHDGFPRRHDRTVASRPSNNGLATLSFNVRTIVWSSAWLSQGRYWPGLSGSPASVTSASRRTSGPCRTCRGLDRKQAAH